MVTDIDGLLTGRIFQPGIRRNKPRLSIDLAWRNVLIVDDSIDSGGSLRHVRKRVAAKKPDWKITYAAIFGTSKIYDGIDLVFDVCRAPRIFEWNLMHHPHHLKHACLDIDGVLCKDPLDHENDDGVLYENFLDCAKPYLLPTVPVGTLVTSRLEKYRSATEDWLHRQGIVFDELQMLDLKTAEERRRLGAHARFKAQVYGGKKDSWLFIESNVRQAEEIATLSGKAVICTEGMLLFEQTIPTLVRQRTHLLRQRARRLRGRMATRVHSFLKRITLGA
jgi:uncharacterized HAD superfamily protein